MDEKPTVVEIQVDVTDMTLGDLEILMRGGGDREAFKEVMEVLDRVVVGGARRIRILDLEKVVEAVVEAVNTASNPPSQSEVSESH